MSVQKCLERSKRININWVFEKKHTHTHTERERERWEAKFQRKYYINYCLDKGRQSENRGEDNKKDSVERLKLEKKEK